LAFSDQVKPLSFASCSTIKRIKNTPSYRMSLHRDKWAFNNRSLWISQELPLVASYNFPTGVSAAALSTLFVTRNDLVAAVEYILENTAVRNVVVETNGLADPAQSIKQFWFDEEMNIKAELHSVIAVVSARKWEDIYLNPIFEKQIVYANKALVTFMDTSPALKYEEICLNIREMNC
jgi:hypothetical protein